MPVKENNKTVEMAVPLLAGEGKGPTTNKRRAHRSVEGPDVRVPTATPLLDAETTERNAEGTDQKEETKEKEPTYAERLAAANISVTHAREVMDDVLFNQEYTETFNWRDNFQVVLHTREYRDTMRLMRVMEAENPTWQMHINDIIARYNVCASLQQYGDTTFTPLTEKTPKAIEEDFEERLQFIFGLPEIAVNKLIDLVARFDKKVAIIFSEGSIQDF